MVPAPQDYRCGGTEARQVDQTDDKYNDSSLQSIQSARFLLTVPRVVSQPQ